MNEYEECTIDDDWLIIFVEGRNGKTIVRIDIVIGMIGFD